MSTQAQDRALEELWRRRTEHYVELGHERVEAEHFASFDVYGGDAEIDGVPEGDPRIPEAKRITGDA